MAKLDIVELDAHAQLTVHVGIPTHLRPDEGDDSWIVLGPNKTSPDVPPSQAVIQVRRIGWMTPDGKVWQDQPLPAEQPVPIFVPLELKP
jgi:hypothetical protein